MIASLGTQARLVGCRAAPSHFAGLTVNTAPWARGKQSVLVIDNYDSFTFNLVQILGTQGAELTVKRHDEIDLDGIADLLDPGAGIVISPGPGRPSDAGISMGAIRRFGGEIPILGVVPGPPVHRRGLRR